MKKDIINRCINQPKFFLNYINSKTRRRNQIIGLKTTALFIVSKEKSVILKRNSSHFGVKRNGLTVKRIPNISHKKKKNKTN